MTRKTTETLVGAFVLLGLAAIAFLAFQSANLASFSFDATYPLKAAFYNVGGLKVQAPVKVAGVTVGRISSISFDNKTYQGIVTMSIDHKYTFPADSSVKILTAGLLGDQYLGINPGDDDNKTLQSGDKFANAQSAIVLEDLISSFMYSKAAEPPAPATAADKPSATQAVPAGKSTSGSPKK
jgi:phospholipid/cholesterol/gamma-HCH transport system substrate-binding protein